MMEPGVYIVDLEMKAVPIAKNSRLQPISVKSERRPVILDENGNIEAASRKRSCMTLLEGRSMNYDKYRITLKYTNPKFSTKTYGN